MKEKHENDAKRRKKPITKSQILRAKRRAVNPKRRDREQYSTETYGQSIEQAIIKANRSLLDDKKIPQWTPYQLRHAGVTELVFENDGNLDVARAVAGQRSIGVTHMYNHADLQIAIEQAKKRGMQ